MKKIKSSFDNNDGVLVLYCSELSIIKDPRFFMFIKRFRADVKGLEVKIDCSNLKLSEIYTYLQHLVSRMQIELDINDGAESELTKIKNDDETFKKFTAAALDVWKGVFIPEELSSFENIIYEKINRKLSHYQFLSAMHLAFSQNACNFSVPGAGKTTIVYSALAFLMSLNKDDPKHIDRIFVIGPLASYYAWKYEYEKCFGKEPHAYRIFGGVSRGELSSVLNGTDSSYINLDLVHTSFQSAANNHDEIARYLSDKRFSTMLIVDEAHNIKREDGIWSNACISLAKYANSRVVLTGTPAPNGYEDLYNLFKFIYPNKKIIGFKRSNLVAMTQGVMPASNLLSAINPFFTRITKSHLNLPPSYINKIEVDFSAEEREIYNSLEDILVSNIDFDSAADGLKAKVIRLRQAASNFELLVKPIEDILDYSENDEYRKLMNNISLIPFAKSSKAKKLLAICQDLISSNKKILIWSYFIGTIDSIVNMLETEVGCKVHKITGATPSDRNSPEDDAQDEQLELTRESIIKEFNESSSLQILVANPQALGESVSLHYTCHDAIYFDRDFNCGRFIQSKDRIHRYGLPEGTLTNYYFLNASKSIDEVIDLRLQEKEDRMNGIIEREEIPLFSGIDSEDVSFDDLKLILKYYDERKFK